MQDPKQICQAVLIWYLHHGNSESQLGSFVVVDTRISWFNNVTQWAVVNVYRYFYYHLTEFIIMP